MTNSRNHIKREVEFACVHQISVIMQARTRHNVNIRKHLVQFDSSWERAQPVSSYMKVNRSDICARVTLYMRFSRNHEFPVAYNPHNWNADTIVCHTKGIWIYERILLHIFCANFIVRRFVIESYHANILFARLRSTIMSISPFYFRASLIFSSIKRGIEEFYIIIPFFTCNLIGFNSVNANTQIANIWGIWYKSMDTRIVKGQVFLQRHSISSGGAMKVQ